MKSGECQRPIALMFIIPGIKILLFCTCKQYTCSRCRSQLFNAGLMIGLSEYFYFVDSVAKELDCNFLAEARNIDFGQWETSFEAVLLKLIDQEKRYTTVDFISAKELAIAAGIVEEGVLDPKVWSKFCSWYDMG